MFIWAPVLRETYTGPTFFLCQAVIHSQDQSITELLKAVKEQSDQLNHQRIKIKTLEEKVDIMHCDDLLLCCWTKLSISNDFAHFLTYKLPTSWHCTERNFDGVILYNLDFFRPVFSRCRHDEGAVHIFNDLSQCLSDIYIFFGLESSKFIF